MKRVSINDVAQAAGVHRSTVSRALTKSGPVSAEAMEKVKAAVKALNYHPDAQAGALKSKRKQTWGFLSFWSISANSLDHYYAQSLGGLLDSANKAGMRLLLQNVIGRFDETEECLRFCHEALLGGLVILAPRTKEAALKELKRLHVPSVLLCFRAEDPEISFVDVDNAEGVRMAVEHLVSKGHKRIAFIGGEIELSSNARDRYDGYLKGLAQASLPVDKDLIRNGDFEPTFALASIDSLLALPESRRPTAVFCATDPQARAVIAEANVRGLKVPRDLAVVGFDDNPMVAERGLGLTTVHCPFFDLGSLAGQALVQLSQGGAPVQKLVRPELIVRQST